MERQLTHISVEDRDIARGEPTSPHCCPIAYAARRVPGWRDRRITVTATRLRVWDAERHTCRDYFLPHLARAFVYAFDAAQPIQPFQFAVQDYESWPGGATP